MGGICLEVREDSTQAVAVTEAFRCARSCSSCFEVGRLVVNGVTCLSDTTHIYRRTISIPDVVYSVSKFLGEVKCF